MLLYGANGTVVSINLVSGFLRSSNSSGLKIGLLLLQMYQPFFGELRFLEQELNLDLLSFRLWDRVTVFFCIRHFFGVVHRLDKLMTFATAFTRAKDVLIVVHHFASV